MMRRFATLMVVAIVVCIGCGPSNDAPKNAPVPDGKTMEPPAIDAAPSVTPPAPKSEAAPETSKTDSEKKSEPPLKEPKSLPTEEEKKETPASTDSKESSAKPAPAPTTPAPTSTPEPVKPKPDEAAKGNVVLGAKELTSGIPGDGPVSVADIQKWLDNPKNHEVLEFDLPMGLSVGRATVKITEGNPITRAKIELGRQLYFDRRLSADNTVSCADCHHPDDGYARHTQFGVGIGGQQGGRNSPVAYNRILSDVQFWDGRAATLEDQAIGPIANPIEMGNTHEKAVATVQAIEGYRIQFAKVFGGEVTIQNIGKAIATFERAIVTGPAPFDYYEPLRTMRNSLGDAVADLEALKKEDEDAYNEYVKVLKASEEHPISESAQRGREIFFGAKGNCTACHVGANLADEKFHNLGIGMDKAEPDVGRFAVTKDEKERGAFKTPTVRNVAMTAPYMHDGSLKTLAEVVDWYAKGGHPNPQLSDKIKKLDLSDQDKADLVAFMEACTGALPAVRTDRLPE